MALMEFKNLPDTDTPINAENLNYNFNEFNNRNLAVYNNDTVDPDTALEDLVLTSKNVPYGSGNFAYVRTMFFNRKTTDAHRTQIAYPYWNKNGEIYERHYIDGAWTEWTKVGGEKGFIKLTMPENQTIENDTVTIVNLARAGVNTSSALSLEGNGVKIGKNVKQVLVTARWYPSNYYNDFNRGIYIYRNNSATSYNVTQVSGTIETSAVITVTEGDIIQLKCYQATGQQIILDGTSSRTFLQVTII
jgi:hypothetical protein